MEDLLNDFTPEKEAIFAAFKIHLDKLTKGENVDNLDVKLRINGKEVVMPLEVFAFVKMALTVSREKEDKISPSEAAEILRIPERYVFKYIEDEKLKSEKEGGKIYLSKKNVLNFKKERDAMREKGLEELTSIGQRINLP